MSYVEKFSYLRSINMEYIEEIYERYRVNPSSVDDTWRFFFEGIELGIEVPNGQGNGVAGLTDSDAGTKVTFSGSEVTEALRTELKVLSLIQAYRRFGTALADVNPLSPPPQTHPELELSTYGISDVDLDRMFHAAATIGLASPAPLREVLAKLRATYCGKIGFDFAHIQNSGIFRWLDAEVEKSAKPTFTKAQKTRILEGLTRTEAFERFLHTRYVAKKRFSVEGGDALIPLLDTLIEEFAESGATELVIGMAHRGRLNVLTNIFGKSYEHVFNEFEGKLSVSESVGTGDVKYHMGYSADYKTTGGKDVHLSMASNPSHLEFVNPVVEGMARAKQRLSKEKNAEKDSRDETFDARAAVVPVQIHGDAAFAGQGICYETVQLSQVPGYVTGGSIHITVNNQVGFTTSPSDARSTVYSSDMMKMLDCPVFHVNGDHIESVIFVAQLAARFRQEFRRDVMIDLVCYRKYGHNEGDEPSFTQPLMYKIIKDHPSPRELYAKKLIEEGTMTEAEAQAVLGFANAKLQAAYEITKAGKADEGHKVSVFDRRWKGLRHATADDFRKPSGTEVDEKILKVIGKKIGQVPTTFTSHPKLVRLLEGRAQQVEKGEGIDWGTGEALAYGSILWEGTHIRMSGQDVERGTFTHRHAVLYDFNSGQKFTPLNNLKDGQAKLSIYNSVLSEAAVLGFEFGYSSSDANSLVIWEAQFGDFANGAQVIIDQFISSSETKWQRMNGVVLLLPHGFEGQGPEHSSARLERFLQLCSEYNIQVCNLTTPAQIFHALRRQVRRPFRKPLVVMSPKSLLRHPGAVSKLSEFSAMPFREVIDDPTGVKAARKIVLCSGKIYYEIDQVRREKKIHDVAIVRIEQLYPWPGAQLEPIFKKYATAKDVVWTQEEPKNMGAWQFARDWLGEMLGSDQRLTYVGRVAGAAPASGSEKAHQKEQHRIVEEALK